jgi:zinc ribbon protein
MFCNYCGAPNPDGAAFCSTCGKAISHASSGESLPRASEKPVVPSSPLPSHSEVVDTSTAMSSGGTLTQSARMEFVEGLTAEVRRKIGDKPIIWACVTFIAALVLVAGFNKVLALVLALVGAGVVFKLVKDSMEKQYLQPIAGYSDQMLVARYNEVKADRRAAGTRAAIWWAVLIIIGIALVIVWISAHQQQ